MDSKTNDDSEGSDSLDKSLQKKCIVNDSGDGWQHDRSADDQPETAKDSLVSTDSVTAESQTAEQQPTVGTSSDSETAVTSLCSKSSSSSGSPPFETKLKQIAMDLKGTCLADDKVLAHVLAEDALEMCNKIPLEDTSSSDASNEQQQNTSADMDSPSPSPTAHDPTPDSSADPFDLDLDTSRCSTEANDDDEGQSARSRKVHFHPEVKEHDGGIRIIPKKKKKTKESKRLEHDMDQDEDDEETDEEEVLANIMAEADDHLKKNPLFIERPDYGTGPRLRDGLMEEDEVKDLQESSDEEDIHENDSPPVNGVERVLGKMIKNNEVFYLVRYVEKALMSKGKCGWEKEQFIANECSPLLNDYDIHCLKLQAKVMRQVSKCQKKRQRCNYSRKHLE